MTTLSNYWLELTLNLGWVSLMIGGLIMLIYGANFSLYKRPSDKYEFVSKHEIPILINTAIAISVGVAFFTFYSLVQWIGRMMKYEFIFVGFTAVSIAVLVGYAMYAYIKYYHPSVMEKKLRHYRFQDRISPISNKPMRLLNKTEEKVHLKADIMEFDKNLGKDYDVWVDEVSGYKLIEEYDVHEHTLLCNECKLRTLLDYQEEIEKQPTEKESGFLKKHYKCSYCGNHETIRAIIPSLEEERAL